MKAYTTLATVTVVGLLLLGCVMQRLGRAERGPARRPRSAAATASPATVEVDPPRFDEGSPSIAVQVKREDLRPHVERFLSDPSAVQVTPLHEVAATLADHILRMETVVVGESLSALADDVPGLRDAVVAELGRRSATRRRVAVPWRGWRASATRRRGSPCCAVSKPTPTPPCVARWRGACRSL